LVDNFLWLVSLESIFHELCIREHVNIHGGKFDQGEEEKIPYFRCLTPFSMMTLFSTDKKQHGEAESVKQEIKLFDFPKLP
jgi:hypothetical protein